MPSAALLAGSQPAVARRKVPSAWITSRPQISGELLPMQVDLSPSRLGAMIICAAGVLVLASSWEFVQPIPEAQDPLTFALAALFPLIGVGLLGAGLLKFYRRQSVTFGASGVEVVERDLAGQRRWAASYSDYAGVLQREHVVTTRNSSVTYQIIQLLHGDPARDLPLHVERGERVPRQRWESLAERLRLPALQFDDECIAARPAGALDASLAEQVQAGHVRAGDGHHQPPPPGIRIRDEFHAGREAVVIEMGRRRLPLVIYALLCLLPLTFLPLGFVTTLHLPFAAIPVAILAGIGWVYWKDAKSPRALRLSHDAVDNLDTWRWHTEDAATLNIADIEGIRIYRSAKAGGMILAIESDRGTMHVGQGLGRAELVWLRDFLVARIARKGRRASR